MTIRAAAQISLLLVLARIFVPNDYGYFVSGVALASLFTPIAGLGIYGVIVKEGSRTPTSLPTLMGAALRIWAASATLCAITAAFVASIWLPGNSISNQFIFLLFSEIFSSSLVEILARVEQAKHHAERYGAAHAGLATLRLLAILILLLCEQKSIHNWLSIYGSISIAYAFALLIISIKINYPIFNKSTRRPLLRNGMPFLIASLSLKAQAEANKPIIARLGFDSVGHLNVAQRVIDMAILPLSALTETIMPFIIGKTTEKSNKIILIVPILASLPINACIWFLAPLIPLFIGAQYSKATPLIQMLCLLPTLQSARQQLNTLLIAKGTDYKITRSYLLAFVATIATNFLIIPAHGLHGAIAAIYISEFTTCALILIQLTDKKEAV